MTNLMGGASIVASSGDAHFCGNTASRCPTGGGPSHTWLKDGISEPAASQTRAFEAFCQKMASITE